MKNKAKIKKCIFCNSEKVEEVLRLNKVSIATKFFNKPKVLSPKYPLGVSLCKKCLYIQNTELINPSLIFNKNYNYYSNSALTFLKHLKKESVFIKKRFNLNKNSKVLEVASNDGSFQGLMQNLFINTLGVEPSKKHYLIAKKRGLKVYNSFFDTKLINKKKLSGLFDLVIMRNVISHTPKPFELLNNGKKVLAKNGAIILETVIQNFNFESPYHGVYSYFSIYTLINLITKAGLLINQIKIIESHGVTVRVILVKPNKPDDLKINQSFNKKFNFKKELNFTNIKIIKKFYQKSSKEINTFKSKFKKIQKFASLNKMEITGYGAAGRTYTYLSVLGSAAKSFNYICDINKNKWNKYFANSNLIIKNPKILEGKKNSIIIVFTWNFFIEIKKYLKKINYQGKIINIKELLE
jgi:SAM-dependent methyltransferase